MRSEELIIHRSQVKLVDKEDSHHALSKFPPSGVQKNSTKEKRRLSQDLLKHGIQRLWVSILVWRRLKQFSGDEAPRFDVSHPPLPKPQRQEQAPKSIPQRAQIP